MDESTQEVRSPQGFINDLMSLMALPALWRGHPPSAVTGTLLEVLVRLLGLDFAYALLTPGYAGAAAEIVKVTGRKFSTTLARDIGAVLAPTLVFDGPCQTSCVRNPLGRGEVNVLCCSLGLTKDIGTIVAGAQRADFPTHRETLLVRTAVNQAVLQMHTTQLLAERARAVGMERATEQLQAENVYLRSEVAPERTGGIIGHSPALRAVLKLVEMVAPTDACVLLQGETGTGKGVIADAIHRLSLRRDRVQVKLNCAAIPAGLLESELFGHGRGAFTGAVARKIGRFELADRGTLFLDEVGEIPIDVQSKLLRVMQEHEFEPLGSTRTIKVDVRIIAATNRELKKMVVDGQFRSDLYYRLYVFPITVPPLRDRKDDIALLARHFMEKYAQRMKKQVTYIPPETIALLRDSSWPGNVREIENLIERSVILSTGTTLDVPLGELTERSAEPQTPVSLQDVEREHIRRALQECNWVIAGRAGAAARLGMKRTSLQYRMRKLGIRRPAAT